MTTRSLHDTLLPTMALPPEVITGSALNTGDEDLRGFDSALFMVEFGDIDEMGGSPVGGAQLAILVETAPDDGTGSAGAYVAVADGEIDTDETVAAGIITVTTDVSPVTFGVLTIDRFARVTLTPTGLTNGGPVSIALMKGHAGLSPV